MVLLQNRLEQRDSLEQVEDVGLGRRKSKRELPKEIEEGGELKWSQEGG
jgi:hypothetical protein